MTDREKGDKKGGRGRGEGNKEERNKCAAYLYSYNHRISCSAKEIDAS